jgi:citrate lyase gamma subunit
MEIIKDAMAGTLESSDVMVRIGLPPSRGSDWNWRAS